MSDVGPSLSDYPGYFPAAKPPFWTRTKVGTVAGIAGLLVGIGGPSGSTETADQPVQATHSFTQADIDSAVQKATSDLQSQLASNASDEDEALNQQLAAAQDALVQQREQAKVVLARVKKQAAREQRQAVKAATASAKAEAQQQLQQFAGMGSSSSTGSGGGTDPRFDYCYEANDAGYGNYVSGQDPEYDWYRDSDGDGVVCEF